MRISDWSSDVCSSDLDDLLVHVQELMTFLINKTLRTRHFVSNTIIDASQGATVRGKSSMLVLLHNAYSEEPEFDYSATLKAEFAKGADNIWRFSRLTLLTDSHAVSDRKSVVAGKSVSVRVK